MFVETDATKKSEDLHESGVLNYYIYYAIDTLFRDTCMKIDEIIWIESIVEKLANKHNVSIYEVEYVLKGTQRCRMVEKGKVQGDNVYSVMGQTAGGRYLILFFILKKSRKVIPISARDMDAKERRMYGRT
jgi:uncharacterized DUF497 family protein